jgi:hypothetical protein
MISLLKALPLLLCLAPKEGAELFSGAIDMKLKMESGSGDLRLFVDGGRNARLDMKVLVNPLPEPLLMSFLFKGESPKKVFLVNDQAKTYSEVALDTADSPMPSVGKGKYQVKILGKGKILGYTCTHLTLTRDKDWVDAWISKDVGDLFWILKRLQEANPQIGEAEMFKALEESDQRGMPMRYTVVREGQRVTTYVTKIEKKAHPASLFAIPKEYRRTEGGGAGGLQPTPEQVEEMKRLIEGALQGQ